MNDKIIYHSFCSLVFFSKFILTSPNKKEVFMQSTDQSWTSSVTNG